jgi:hypothetical protein
LPKNTWREGTSTTGDPVSMDASWSFVNAVLNSEPANSSNVAGIEAAVRKLVGVNSS